MTNDDIALLRRVFHCIDHTTLDPTDNRESVMLFGERLASLCDDRVGEVASVCTWTPLVTAAKAGVLRTGIKACAVAGGFPSGQMTFNLKMEEIRTAVKLGAEEVDVVFPLNEFFMKKPLLHDSPMEVLGFMRQNIGDRTSKCIIETGLLRTPENIACATQMVIEAGFDFVKTSTGKTAVGATPEAVGVMLEVLKKHKAETGETVGLKVSGGVSTPEKALLYAHMAQEAMGDDYISKQHFRIGTSSLTERLATFLTKEISDC